MSKTMDNDGRDRSGSNGQSVYIRDYPVNEWVKTMNSQAAEIERLTGLLEKSECANQGLQPLRARVEELEAENQNYFGMLGTLDIERDTLREQLEETRDTMKEWKGKYENMLECKNALRAELEGESAALKVTQKLLREKMDELKQVKMEREMPINPYITGRLRMPEDHLQAENARLKDDVKEQEARVSSLSKQMSKLEAELAALKPVPVVGVRYVTVYAIGEGVNPFVTDHRTCSDNLKLTLTNGVLTGAEVLGGEG